MTHLTPQERRVAIFLLCVFAIGMAWTALRQRSGCSACLTEIFSKPAGRLVDLNRASRQELIDVPGIGPVTADAIITYRTEHGNFRSLDELKMVPGIRLSKLELLKKYLTVGGI